MIYRTFLLLALSITSLFAGEDEARLTELNAYWGEVSRSVHEGDFEGYRATCHPDGVLVSGTKNTSYLLADALKKWNPNFLNTKTGKVKASVEFRFSQRRGDAATAHETGMFRYAESDAEGTEKFSYINLIALLVKKEGKWLILMENQESEGTIEDWNKLTTTPSE